MSKKDAALIPNPIEQKMIKIVITYPTGIHDEINHMNQLLNSDIDYVHIRKPQFDQTQMEDYIQNIDPAFHYKLVIHSHYQLIQNFDLGGIHLNKKSMSQLMPEDESEKCFIEPLMLKNGQVEVYRMVPNSVSYSAHSIEEIRNLSFKVDYAFLSPIFDSISKPDYQSRFSDLDQLELDLATLKTPVIALGGVTSGQFDIIKSTGFHGYAQMGNYWKKYITIS